MEIKHPARSRISLCSPSERMGFPGGVHGEEPACQCRDAKRRVFDPWVGKIPWRRKWQPTPVFFPGESHGQRSLVGYSPRGRNASDVTEATYHVCNERMHIKHSARVLDTQEVPQSL